MKKRVLSVILTIAMAATMVVGCGSSGSADSDTIKFAYVGPLTGDCAEDGTSAQQGAELAVKVLNDNGGIDGKKVELVSYDDKGDTKEAATVATKVATDKSICAVVGHYNSGCTLAGAPIYEKNKMPIMAVGSSANSVSDAGDYIFRDVNSDDASAYDCANWAINDMGYKNIAIMYENDDYGSGLEQSFEKYADQFGATITTSESYILGETKDFTAILTKISQTDTDMIFIAGLYNETALIMKQEHQIGMNLPCIGTDSLYSAGAIELGGEDVEGMYCIGGFTMDTEDEDTLTFIKGYQDEYNEDPNTFAANGYDAVMVYAEAIKANDGVADREAIKDQLYKINGYKGVGGEISFDENGDVHKEYFRFVVKDGKFTNWEG